MVLYIYCAGGLGKEICDLARFINSKTKRWKEISFIDDIRLDKEYYGAKIYRFHEAMNQIKKDEVELIIASGEPYARGVIYQKITDRQLPLATLIHPDTTISPSAKLGKGVIVKKDVSLSSDVTIKDNVLLQGSLMIGHDTEVESHSVISPYVVLNGNCKVGERTYIAPSASIKDRISIGDDSIVGIGSVVVRNVKTGSIVFGNPARKIGDNTEHTVFGI